MAQPESSRIGIIGGGIVGLSTARALADRGHRVVLVEKEDGWARHQTGHNSGVIHSGLYYRPGSLKARFATEAAQTLPELCAELGVTARRTGKLVVATRPDELPRMRALAERGRANGVPVREITPGEAREREPHLVCVGALLVDSTGVADFAGLARAFAAELTARGATLRLGETVTGLLETDRGVMLQTTRGEIAVDHVINCSGLYSDRLLPDDERRRLRIVPFRGEYWTLRRPELVNGLVYPVPDPDLPFLGIHLTRGFDGHVHVGPNAVLALAREGYRRRDLAPRELADTLRFPGFWRLARRHLRYGIAETTRSLVPPAFLAGVRRMLPEVAPGDLVRSPAGVRAQLVLRDGTPSDDFVIISRPRITHVVNAPSPAATASVQIGRHLAGLVAGRA
ncbi:L-2-hydroxyglutarate oxidase [Naumannella cuiyingiana]|uniref:L-2-hydroxyglutarate oxidase n=1 Tax=Naumannella cuiyingiana TaxID=1347891 RepID=A0A7Z0D9F0_9ACTN|nr:L-2-hydroxyglutarate oxidase [Naumannella cuiyingiana]